MELEFDKEIDAILRKARRADVDVVKTPHLDADAVAAFAENALPGKAKFLYTEHFAECGRCRKLLAESVAWPPAETARKSVAAVSSGSIPWYSRLFRTPNLALAMGGLLLVFGGMLAFLMLKKNSADQNSTVSQVMSSERRPSVADQEPAAQSANSNAAMSNTAAAANVASNVMPPPVTRTETEPAAKPVARGPADTPPAAGFTTDGIDPVAGAPANQPKPVGAAPPPPLAASRPPETEQRKDDAVKEEPSRDAKQQEDRMARDVTPPVASRKSAAKLSGPRQNAQTNTVDSNMSQNAVGGRAMSSIKTAGGKRFEKRDGAWYDTSYHGQGTKDVSRNSPAYKELDNGLKSIASSLGGVVVVVWKGTAYRIQ